MRSTRNTICEQTSLALLLCGMLVAPTLAVANVSGNPTVSPAAKTTTSSLTGVLRSFSKNNPAVFTESWVLLSEHGMRVSNEATKTDVIKNFTQRRVWLQDRRVKLHHEIDVADFRKQYPEHAHYLEGRETKSNVLGSTPCSGWDSSYRGDRVWRGMIVQDWSCKEASGNLVNTQYFSEQYRMVVRVQHPDSQIEEFRSITERQTLPTDFLPDANFSAATIDEFANLNQPLETFEE